MVDRESLFARTSPLRPGPAGRILWLLVIFIASFCAWASWAEVDEQVRARGEIIASSQSKVVQAVDGGVLSALHVDQGDVVEEGELLAELDTARFMARSAETRAKVIGLQATIERLKGEIEDRPLDFPPLVASVPAVVEAQTNLYERRREGLRESIDSLRQSLSLARQELEALQDLASTGDAAQAEVLKSRREVTELKAEINNQRNDYRSQAQEELANARSELDQAVQVLNQREEELQSTRIHAPRSGKVKNVEITTIGAVLQSGDTIMEIVPSDDPLIVEARVSSADVAFIRPGLQANVKLDAYDFTVYGAMEGEVTYISPDTIDEDLKQDEDPYYRVLIRVGEKPEKKRGKEPVEVIPGMTTTVEVITGNRTVAQYLMKPVLRGSSAALTER